MTGTGSQQIVGNIIYDCSIDMLETYENLTTEVWKRILNNLPYLYKTKGTVRGLRALITSYGIPSSILYVREYGGPDLDTVSYSNINEYKLDNFITVLPFYASQSINVDWLNTNSFSRYPSTIQVRVNITGSTYTKENEMSIIEVPGNWCLSVVPTGSGALGYVKFQLVGGPTITSSVMPLYNGNYTFINLQRESATDDPVDQTFSLIAKQYVYNSILYAVSTSVVTTAAENISWRSAGTVVIGGSGSVFASPFYGYMDEFRLWDSPLKNYIIDTHVKFPESYIGNTVTGSYTDLLLRFGFDDPLNMASYQTQSFVNNAASQDYDLSNLKIYGWSDAPEFPYSYITDTYEGEAHALNVGINRYSSNKVRIEDGILTGHLSHDSYREIGMYDTAQLDSNKLGIFFSPTEMINEDIIKKLAVSDIGDLIGKASDAYELIYSDLLNLSQLYWKLGSNRISISDYLNYIKYYDPSLFDHIQEFIPARCQSVVGILYEPTILERPKVKHRLPKVERNDYSQKIDVLSEKTVGGEYYGVDGVILASDIKLNSFNFAKANIYSILDASSIYSGSGNTVGVVYSTVDFETNIIYSTNVLNIIKTSATQQYSFTNGYNSRHYRLHQGYYTWEKRLKYEGCKQTIDTTVDRKEAVEVWETNPNRLISRDDGRSNLQIL